MAFGQVSPLATCCRLPRVVSEMLISASAVRNARWPVNSTLWQAERRRKTSSGSRRWICLQRTDRVRSHKRPAPARQFSGASGRRWPPESRSGAAAGVDHHHPVFHLIESFAIEQVVVFVGQRTVQEITSDSLYSVARSTYSTPAPARRRLGTGRTPAGACRSL